MYKKIDHIQGSPQWKAWRRFKIGASEIAAIMGDCPYSTPLQLWERKIHGEEIESNAAMERGKEFEIEAREEISARMGANYQPICFESITYPHLIASLDGWDENSYTQFIEIKYTKKEWHDSIMKGIIPIHFQWQLQQQMLVTGTQTGLLCSYRKNESAIHHIDRNEEMQKQIIEETKKFYNRLMSFDPPPICHRDTVQVEDDRMNLLELEYGNLDFICKIHAERMKEIKSELIDWLEKNQIKRAVIGSITISFVSSQGRVNYKKLAELYVDEDVLEEVIEDFRGEPSESWRIT